MMFLARKRILLNACLIVLFGVALAHSQAQAGKWKFIFFADSNSLDNPSYINTNILGELARASVRENPAFLVFGGDMAYYPSKEGFLAWSNAVAPVYQSGIPVLPIFGNHEEFYRDVYDAVFTPTLPTADPIDICDRNYAVAHENGLLLLLDTLSCTNDYRVNLGWLQSMLSTNARPHVFAFSHIPAFKVVHKDCLDDYYEQRDAFWRMLGSVNCRLYFSGHDHFYDHTRLDDFDGNPANDIHQVIVGTGGGAFYLNDVYDGMNSVWSPVRLLHQKDFGYVSVEIDGDMETVRWHRRIEPEVFAVEEKFTVTPRQGPRLNFEIGQTGHKLTLSWSGAAVLQSAPRSDGPFIDMPPDVRSPFVATNLLAPAFFRLRALP